MEYVMGADVQKPCEGAQGAQGGIGVGGPRWHGRVWGSRWPCQAQCAPRTWAYGKACVDLGKTGDGGCKCELLLLSSH